MSTQAGSLSVSESGQAPDLEPFFAALLTHAAAGVAFMDCNGRFVAVGDGLAALNGISAEAHRGRLISEVVPDLWPQGEPYAARVLAGESVTFEIEGRAPGRPADHQVWLVDWFPVRDEDGTVIGTAATVISVTEARTRERHQRALAELGRVALALDADLEAVFAAASEQVQQALRVPLARVTEVVAGSDEIVLHAGTGWSSLVRTTGPRSGSYTEYVMRFAEPVVVDDLSQEERFRIPATLKEYGVQSTIATRIDGARGPQGIVAGHSPTRRSFTDDDRWFMQSAASLLSLAMQARETRALQVELIGIASHEIRTPLTTVIGTLQSLERRLSRQAMSPPEVAEWLHSVVEDAFRMDATINRWMSAAALQARSEPVQREVIDLNAFVAQQARAAHQRHPRLTVTIDSPGHEAIVISGSGQLTEILENLLENAVRHAGEDARVIVAIERQADGTRSIAVRDNGPGIPADALPRIFERRYRARGAERGRGLGLGLYVSRLLAEEIGATLVAENGADGGACFTLNLPDGVESA